MATSSQNPWLTIWFKPKVTMRNILEKSSKKWIYVLATLGAFTHIAGNAGFWFNSWWISFAIWILLSMIAGLLGLYVFGGFLKWTGGWLHGKGSMQDVMSVVAWSQIPVICFFIIEMVILLSTGGQVIGVVYSSILLAFSLWAFVIFLCCLSEAQQFSFFKSLMNWLISIVILAVIVVMINVVITLISGGNPQTNVQSS